MAGSNGSNGAESESIVRAERNVVAVTFSPSEEDHAAANTALDRVEACLA